VLSISWGRNNLVGQIKRKTELVKMRQTFLVIIEALVKNKSWSKINFRLLLAWTVTELMSYWLSV